MDEAERPPREVAARAAAVRQPLRHWLAFLLGGAFAFIVDAIILKALTILFGVHPILARLAAISVAMVAAWLAHRTFTFAVPGPPSMAEFLRYAAVAWTSAAINYVLFAAIILARPGIEPLVALFASSLVAMVFAYLGMRFAAFRAHE